MCSVIGYLADVVQGARETRGWSGPLVVSVCADRRHPCGRGGGAIVRDLV